MKPAIVLLFCAIPRSSIRSSLKLMESIQHFSGRAAATAEKIGVEVEIFDPFEGLAVEDRSIDPDVVSRHNTAATVSIGLALRNLEARK